jgi:hypothetical protein
MAVRVNVRLYGVSCVGCGKIEAVGNALPRVPWDEIKLSSKDLLEC